MLHVCQLKRYLHTSPHDDTHSPVVWPVAERNHALQDHRPTCAHNTHVGPDDCLTQSKRCFTRPTLRGLIYNTPATVSPVARLALYCPSSQFNLIRALITFWDACEPLHVISDSRCRSDKSNVTT